MESTERAMLDDARFEAVKSYDLGILITPYVTIGIVILVMLLLIAFTRMPGNAAPTQKTDFLPTLKRIFARPKYRQGVIAQFFYVGAQIMCWTFIIQYGTRIFMENGMGEKEAEVLSQKYNILAMTLFCTSRFVCTFLLRYLNPGKLLAILAVLACACTAGVILLQDLHGIYCLVGVSACMSLMFPTIYGIALEGMGDDAKFGAAGLIMAILGGSALPPLQALIIDRQTVFGMPAVNISFILSLLCFIVVAIYGYRSYTGFKHR
jgi:FHS family L-fucose permease-like MFS transporter